MYGKIKLRSWGKNMFNCKFCQQEISPGLPFNTLKQTEMFKEELCYKCLTKAKKKLCLGVTA